MARFEVDGLDDLFAEMNRMGELYGATTDEMLVVGGETVKEEWKKSAERHKHRVTGDMIESITYSRQPKKVQDIKSVDIYPQGKGSNGVRNAEKAFIANYGTTSQQASNWVDEADQASEEKVYSKFEEIWNKRLEEIGGK